MKNQTRAPCARTPANIASVAHSVEENPRLSIPRHYLELDISQTTLHWILHKDLWLKVYKVELTQEVKPAAYQPRCVFPNWELEIHENESEWKISSKEHGPAKNHGYMAISIILFFIINGKSLAIEWNKN